MSEHNKFYRFGLDIGIASVGWAVVQTDEYGNTIDITRAGSRVFEVGQDTTATKNADASLSLPRRTARGARRRNRRHKFRLVRAKQLMVEWGMFDSVQGLQEELYGLDSTKENIYEIRYNALDKLLDKEQFAKLLVHWLQRRGYKSNAKESNKLKTGKGQSKEKSSGDDDKEDQEAKKALGSIAENTALMQEKGYRTVGEMLYKDSRYAMGFDACRTTSSTNADGRLLKTRNTTGDYKGVVLREQVQKEIEFVFDSQLALGNQFATAENKAKYVAIFVSQRHYSKGPGGLFSGFGIEGINARREKEGLEKFDSLIDKMTGKCIFYPNEFRASKASYSFEKFRLYQDLNHMKINYGGVNEKKGLTKKQFDIIFALCHQKQTVKYKDIRKALELERELDPNDTFAALKYEGKKKKDGTVDTSKNAEDVALKAMPAYQKFRSALKDIKPEWFESVQSVPVKVLDDLATVISNYKDDDSLVERLVQIDGVDGDVATACLDLSFSGVGNLSIKAIHEILPHWQPGITYDKACTDAKLDFKAEGKGDRSKKLKLLQHAEQNGKKPINNPVVRRSVAQTIKVVNALVEAYGSPIAINIELGRDMSKTLEERRDVQKKQDENRDKNENAKKWVQECYPHKSNITGIDILKVNLHREQDGICMYSGGRIGAERLLEEGYCEIDHIKPYSICFDDSKANKVLVLSAENQQKGNRLPLEYLKGQKREDYIARANSMYQKWPTKRNNLLKTHISPDEEKEFISRNLNDMRYATRVILNCFRQNLIFADAPEFQDEKDGEDNIVTKKKRVTAVNGSMTSYIRSRFGLNKIREEGDTHHALDAIVIACTTDGYIQQVSKVQKALENKWRRQNWRLVDGNYVDYDTGEVISQQEFKDRDLHTREIRAGVDKKMQDIYNNNEYLSTKEGIKQFWNHEFSPIKDWTASDFRHAVEELVGQSKGIYDSDSKTVTITKQDGTKKTLDKIFVSRKPTRTVTGRAHKDTIYGVVKDEHGAIDVTQRTSKTNLASLCLDKDGEIKDYYRPQSDRLLYNALKKHMNDYIDAYGKYDGAKAFGTPFLKDGTFFKPIDNKDGTYSKGNVVKSVKTVETNISLQVGIKNRGQDVDKITGFAKNDGMVRIDVYKENKSYYCVPIYINDVVKSKLPDVSAPQGKQMDESFFEFSLYPNDLVWIRDDEVANQEIVFDDVDIDGRKKGNKTTKLQKVDDGYFYYRGFDISGGQVRLIAHDKYPLKKQSGEQFVPMERDGSMRKGIKGLKAIQKCEVDPLGNVRHVFGKQKRQTFDKK